MAPPTSTRLDFPEELRGKKVLLATESFGPVNGVSRTTQSLVEYLRAQGVNVATCAPGYAGQAICGSKEVRDEKNGSTIINQDWVKYVQDTTTIEGARAFSGAWNLHHEKAERTDHKQAPTARQIPRMLNTKPLPLNPEHRLSGLSLPYNPDLKVAYPFRLSAILDRTFQTPDLIYLASPASVGFQILLQLAQHDAPPPTMLNFQTDLSHYATILFCRPIRQYAVWLLAVTQGFLFSVPAVKKIFYPSGYIRTYMESTGAPAAKMQQLGRGVDTAIFSPSQRDPLYRAEIAPNKEVIFCCISRLAPEKGFEFLASAALKLAQSGLDFKLLIVGGNKNSAVENEVKRLFLCSPLVASRTVFTGMLHGEALARAFAVADIFLHCSVTETFGLVVLESMASGVPVIARDEGGPSETIKPGESGYLIPKDNLDDFVDCARWLAVEHEARAKMSRKAIAQAGEATWDKINCAVAVEMAAVIKEAGNAKVRPGFHNSLLTTCKVYLAVGLVWVFWLVAVVPVLLCGYFHR